MTFNEIVQMYEFLTCWSNKSFIYDEISAVAASFTLYS